MENGGCIMITAPKERRLKERRPICVNVYFPVLNYMKIKTSEDTNQWAIQIIDITELGIGFVTKEVIQVNDLIAFDLLLNKESIPFECVVKIKRISKNAECFLAGAEFVLLKDIDRRQITQYIKSTYMVK